MPTGGLTQLPVTAMSAATQRIASMNDFLNKRQGVDAQTIPRPALRSPY